MNPTYSALVRNFHQILKFNRVFQLQVCNTWLHTKQTYAHTQSHSRLHISACIYAHTFTHANFPTHTFTRAHNRVRIQIIHMCTQPHTRLYMDAHTYAVCTYTYAVTFMNAHSCTRTLAGALVDTRSFTHTYVHSHTSMHTRPRICKREHSHTHIRALTRARVTYVHTHWSICAYMAEMYLCVCANLGNL